MNRKMVMALRTVCGYTDDLTVKLPVKEGVTTEPALRIRLLITSNFGTVMAGNDLREAGFDDPKNPAADPLYLVKLKAFCDREAEKVCLGIVDD